MKKLLFLFVFMFLFSFMFFISKAHAINFYKVSDHSLLSHNRVERILYSIIPYNFIKKHPFKDYIIKLRIHLVLKKGFTNKGFHYNVETLTYLSYSSISNPKKSGASVFESRYYARFGNNGMLKNPSEISYKDLSKMENSSFLHIVNGFF